MSQLSVTGQWDRYSKNFLSAREDSRYNGLSARNVSLNLFPIPYLSLNGSLNDRQYLLGAGGRSHGYSYGAGSRLPGALPLQLNYFRSVQIDPASPMGRFELRQYSAMIPRFGRFTLNSNYAVVLLAGSQSRNLSNSLDMQIGKSSTVSLQDFRQWGNSHRMGVAWDYRWGARGSYPARWRGPLAVEQ